MIKFPDKSWMKNSINGEVKKVRNSRHIHRQFWRVIFVTFCDAISDEYYLSIKCKKLISLQHRVRALK